MNIATEIRNLTDYKKVGAYNKFVRDFPVEFIETFDKDFTEAIMDSDYREAIALVDNMVLMVISDEQDCSHE